MGALYVENVVITGFNAGNAAGIRFQPANASAKLFVTDSIMDHNGISTTTGGGIVVVPSTGFRERPDHEIPNWWTIRSD